jgi:flagellum-specific peptidoglycan hydrolase FlgJ
MLTPLQLDSLAKIATAAVECERTTDVPAEVTTAQAVLESAWLTKAPGNNCFGVKAYSGCFARQLLSTKEWFTASELARFLSLGGGRTAALVDSSTIANGRREYEVQDWFAMFETLTSCFVYHALLLSMGKYGFYLRIFKKNRDLDAYIAGIAPIYATDPGYSLTLSTMAHGPNITAAIKLVRNGGR